MANSATHRPRQVGGARSARPRLQRTPPPAWKGAQEGGTFSVQKKVRTHKFLRHLLVSTRW